MCALSRCVFEALEEVPQTASSPYDRAASPARPRGAGRIRLSQQDPSPPARKPPPPPGRKKSRPPSGSVPVSSEGSRREDLEGSRREDLEGLHREDPEGSPSAASDLRQMDSAAGSLEEFDADELDLEAWVLEAEPPPPPTPPVSGKAPGRTVSSAFEGAATLAIPSTDDLARASAAMADEWVADLATTHAPSAVSSAVRASTPTSLRPPTGPIPRLNVPPPPGAMPPRPPTLLPVRRPTGMTLPQVTEEHPTILESPRVRPRASTPSASVEEQPTLAVSPRVRPRVSKPSANVEENPTLLQRPGLWAGAPVPDAPSSEPVLGTVLGRLVPSLAVDLAAYERALHSETQPSRLARLHFEAGRIHELGLGQLDDAARHYSRALTYAPDQLPVITAARRLMIARGEYGNALELFDRELHQTREAGQRAMLLLMKGRLLEDRLRQPAEARKVYAAAMELAGSDAVILEAQAWVDEVLGSWRALSEDVGRLASTVGGDARVRAALLADRARLAEVHHRDPEEAAQLYESALALDPQVTGVIDALKRLHHDGRRWRELVAVLEREVAESRDATVRMMALYQMGVVLAERLGHRDEAIAAFERGASEVPGAMFVLEALARLYEQAQAYPELCATLRRLAGATADPRQRLGYLHRIGDLSRDALDDRDAAMAAYEAALEIDPTYVPALRALSLVYAARGQWVELVRMYEAEVLGTQDTPRRAAAHARAAGILERLDRRTEAMAHHEHALALDPELAESFRALVRIYMRSGEYPRLIELYERGIERADVERRIEYLFNVADLYHGPLAQPQAALEAYGRILELRPDHLGAVHAMQRVAEGANLLPALVASLEAEAAIVSDHREVVALVYRAGSILHDDLNAPEGAVERFNRVLELDPHHRPSLASLGRLYYAAGQWEDLARVYRLELEVTQEKAAKVALLYKVGELEMGRLGRVELALESFRRALVFDPRHGPSLQMLARILRERGDWTGLVKLAEDELQGASDPEAGARAAYRAGELYEEHLGQPEAAEEAYARAISLRPHDRPAADALARVQARLGRWHELVHELERAAVVTQDPSIALTLLVRAAQTWSDRLHDDAHAIACYERALALDPRDLTTLRALTSLYRKRRDWAALADALARQEGIVADPGIQAALLVERLRVLEVHVPGSETEQAVGFAQLLTLRGEDRLALAGLERLAIAQGDTATLGDVDARLLALSGDPKVKAAHLTRLAETMEVQGDPGALGMYRQALQLHPDNWAAQRGLSRCAQAQGDGHALAEASEIAATTAASPQEAAEAWVHCAEVRLTTLRDSDGAAQALEKALSFDPDHIPGAEQLSALYRERGEYDRLVDRLSRAGASARRSERQSALWIEVSRLYEVELANLGAALTAIRRLCEIQPDNLEALLEQARLLTTDRRYDEAAAVLQAGVRLAKDGDLKLELETMLAHCYESVDDPEQALVHYNRALDLQPESQELLAKVIDLQLQRGAYPRAAEAATRFVQVARDDRERTAGLLRLAQARAGLGQSADAIEHLAEAMTLDGRKLGADREIRAIAREPEHWSRYVAALRQRLETLEEPAASNVYLEIARVQASELGRIDDGMSTLIEGLRRNAASIDLRLELADRLRDRERYVEAIEQFQYLLMDEVTRPEAWRGLGHSFERNGQLRERDMTACALTVLAAADPADRAIALAWRSSCAVVPAGAFMPAAVPELYVARQQQEPAANLVAAMSEGIAKVRPPDLGRYGVGFRDKLSSRSDSVLRSVIDHVARAMGVEEFEVYVHQNPELGVIVENLAKPTLVVPARLGEQPASTQVFQLAYALFNTARGLHPLLGMSSQEVGVLLASAARLGVPSYRSPLASDAVLDEHAKALARGISRKKRKAFEDAADAYARAPAFDAGTFLQWSRQTARRVALIFADDLEVAIEQVAREERIAEPPGIARFERSPVLADLLKVWVSKPAMLLRQRLRLVQTSLPPAPPAG